MCGVAGLLIKDPDLQPELGSMLASMISALAERGPDSSGFAVYTRPAGHRRRPTMRLSVSSEVPLDWAAVSASVQQGLATGVEVECYDRAVVIDAFDGVETDVGDLLATRWPGARIVGHGASVAVVKDVGPPEKSCERYRLSEWAGYLAVAHTRMATESAVTLVHSHPFVPAPDLCVVHNGSFSNYASVRRALRSRGVRFESDNDSEVGACLLAERLAAGDDLEEATRWVMKELDGFFTLVITTATGMSVVRDAFACKPAVIAETPRFVAVASEYRALASLSGIRDAEVFEPQPEEVYTWSC